MPSADADRDSPDQRLAPQPRRFAHFRILGSLGGGGMGDVYLALDERLSRKVALKLIRKEALWSQDAKQRFQRETLAVGRLDHPSICKLYEAGEHEGWPYMALQLIEGETLARRIERARAVGVERGEAPSSSAPATRADIVATIALIEQVARALHHAHEQGLVHRDVKPGNVMVASGGRPVVLDFGLVRDEHNLAASLSSSRRGVGTPLYMSPEQVSRRGEVDARTDVYSLGVTLYECLTHERPFDAATEAELAEQILANVYPDPRRKNRHLPPELGLVIACALDRDPGRRYRTALAMAEDLRRVIDWQPVQARAIGSVLRLRRWAQRNPTLLAAGALALAAVLGLVYAADNAILATRQQGLANARADEARTNLDRFRQVSDVVLLQDAKAIERTLHPAWPEKAQALRDWLRDHGEPLAGRLPSLEAALDELRRRARAWTPEEQEAQRESHPRHAELQQLRADLASMLRAIDVRAGKSEVELCELDATAGDQTAYGLYWFAAAKTGRGGGFRLACLRLALVKIEAGDASVGRSNLLMFLAWTCYQNGLDAEAMQRIREAAEWAPPGQRTIYEANALRLAGAIASWQGESGEKQLAEARAKIASLEAEVAKQRDFDYEDEGDRFLHVTLSRLVDDLRAFTGERGELPAVRRRLVAAESVFGRSIEDHRAQWEDSLLAIASSDGVRASRRYDHLVMKPQLGLVPIGMDPESKLWEFAHLASGAIGKRDPQTNRLVIADETGIVLVLIPGGTFAMGAQKKNAKGRNYDPGARSAESPVHDVTLSAFFLSKYEITKGQWQRLAGGDPPGRKPGTKYRDQDMTLHHPATDVDWSMCDSLMTESGLCLPTEAQWEFGCRACTTTRWCTGDRPESLLEPSPARSIPGNRIEEPVGGYAPNAFGLHDVCGNVNEWCRDWRSDYGGEVQPGDGLRLGGSERRTLRGGSYGSDSAKDRSAARTFRLPTHRDLATGMRPARIIRQ